MSASITVCLYNTSEPVSDVLATTDADGNATSFITLRIGDVTVIPFGIGATSAAHARAIAAALNDAADRLEKDVASAKLVETPEPVTA